MMPRRGNNKYKKTSISLRDDIMQFAREAAHNFHGNNLSGYLTTLISNDMQGIMTTVVEVQKDISRLDMEPVSKNAKNAIDDILDFAIGGRR